MGPVEEQLSVIRPDVEQEVRKNLKGITGILLGSFLPQVWVFETERETVSVVVFQDGRTVVEGRPWQPRDVTIRWKESFLVAVLKSRSRASVPPGEMPEVEYHTMKGREAVRFLRGRLGL